MSDAGTETILAAIEAHAAALRGDIAKLEKSFEASTRALTLEIREYRKVAMDLFNQLLEVAVVQERMKEQLTQLEARVTLRGGNGTTAPTDA